MEEKSGIEQLKTTNRDPSPVSQVSGGRQNIYKNNKLKKQIYNIKCYINSTNKKSNQSQNITNNTIESYNIKSIFENNNDEKNYQNLATNVRIQNNLIEEYQRWINILLTAINNKKNESSYNDIGTPIQEGLEDIEQLKQKNFEIKSKIIQTKIKNENLEKQIEKNKKTQNLLIKEYNEKDTNNGLTIKKEKEQLIFNVQMLANELDELNENNKQLYDKIQKEENLKTLYDLIIVKKQLKEENKLFKKMIV